MSDFSGFTPHQLAAAADVLSRWEPADESDIELVRPVALRLRELADTGHQEALDDMASVEAPQPSPLTLHLSYEPPCEPPDSGADWPEERDYPGVMAEVRLPVETRELPAEEGAGDLRADLQHKELCCCGETLVPGWGEPWHGENGLARCAYRYRVRIFHAPTLEAAEAAAYAWHAEGVEAIGRIIAARETRMAQRAATIAAAHARSGTIEIPA